MLFLVNIKFQVISLHPFQKAAAVQQLTALFLPLFPARLIGLSDSGCLVCSLDSESLLQPLCSLGIRVTDGTQLLHC